MEENKTEPAETYEEDGHTLWYLNTLVFQCNKCDDLLEAHYYGGYDNDEKEWLHHVDDAELWTHEWVEHEN